MSGSTPQGARNEQEAAHWVRGMFGRVAHRYDLANHLLSFNIDRYWRAHTVRRTRDVLDRPGARVLDICCGTGDLVLALAKHGRPVLGSDFCHPMLVAANTKIARRRAPAVLFESDALALPLRDASLDLITVAFGFRNLANYHSGLLEMRRVLRPGGHGGDPRIHSAAECRLRRALQPLRAACPSVDRWIDLRLARRVHVPA
jgi:demethylmenaquinone methyltransferase/2-methoxy-6-polyprenyl-1,4-benzoquinol methylase